VFLAHPHVHEAGDQVVLRADMVKLENDDVDLAAIRARLALQVVKDEAAGKSAAGFLWCLDLFEVQLAARSKVGSEALATPPLVAVSGSVESREWKRFVAPRAPPHLDEHMFAYEPDGTRRGGS
jgi:hypothetical protein